MIANSAEILTCALQSGSNGNCIYVETPDARLLFDAGISGRVARKRLGEHEREIEDVDGVLISHDHSDHAGGAGVFHRKFKLPLYMTRRVRQATRGRLGVIAEERLHHFEAGDTLRFGGTAVDTVATAHDGCGGVAFVITHGGKSLGIFTDLGHRFEGIEKSIRRLDLLYLESNYDPQMLAAGGYPKWLKQRIVGEGGHLANSEAAELAKDAGGRLQRLILAHLSEHNNRPELAMSTAREHLGDQLPISVARRHGVTEMFAAS